MKILVADDDRVTRALLTRWVTRWGYEVVLAEDGETALSLLLNDSTLQLAVLDWMMPGLNGPEVCRRVREGRSEPYVYMTLLTAKTETDDVVEGLQAGADDYIHKPCHPLELEVRLRVGRRLVELQSNLIAARERLRYDADHDALTGCLNRRAIVSLLQTSLAEARNYKEPLCTVMLDIDHFKAINDSHGHAAGDKVLFEVVRRVQEGLPSGGTIGRYGGEEFLVVLPGTLLTEAQAIAEEIRQALEALPISVGPIGLRVTASLGVASCEQFQRGDAESMMRASDAALYRSKGGGRNRVDVAQLHEFGRMSLPVTTSIEPTSTPVV